MASNPNKTWGQTRITIDGNYVATVPKPTFRPGGVTRNEVEADGQAGFHNEQPASSSLEFKALAVPGLSLKYFQALSDSTVMIEFDTGQTYVMSHAYTADAVEATDGSVSVMMRAPEAEELSL